jgi:tRNA pseudouridine38-40 synthase
LRRMNPRLHAREGFQRYALRIQYHGGSFLGFSKQKQEVEEGDLLTSPRILSVEACLEGALTSLCGGNSARFENLQVSSRTDRGVHAWSNTMHVDLSVPRRSDEKDRVKWWDPIKVVRGLNHHLMRGAMLNESELQPKSFRRRFELSSAANRVRILACRKAPMYMSEPFLQQGWNARFSATRRVYTYRILHGFAEFDFSFPFEWDRSWRIPRELDVPVMQQAALSLVGTHDFTSFQAKGCQRTSPEMTLDSIDVATKAAPSLFLLGTANESFNHTSGRPLLTTIRFVGNAFLYRQVRNLTGCLVSAGLGCIDPREVRRILEARDRNTPQPFTTAPPQGLYLCDVQHGDFHI